MAGLECELCGRDHDGQDDTQWVALNRIVVGCEQEFHMLEATRTDGTYDWDVNESSATSVVLCFSRCLTQWVGDQMMRYAIEKIAGGRSG